GVNFTDFANATLVPADVQLNHDPVLAEEFIFYGGGVSYAINDAIAIGVVARFFLQGYNTRDQSLYGLNLTWDAL
ncbi:MAG: hypothetical protein JWO36_6911, partial [Myxococcales bacterium]|nr:hypothetical protein [Myxococcales bacterium]